MKHIETATIKYSKNYIKNVILRIDFAPILSLNTELKVDFHEKIRTILPFLKDEPINELLTEFKDGKATSTSSIMRQYVFENKSKSKKLTISKQFLVFEVRDFSGFAEFKDRVELIIDNFYKYYKPITITRLGLRYINEIVLKSGSPFEWKGYINDDLIQFLDSELLVKTEVSRIMSQIIYKKEDYSTTFSYGIGNSEFPNTISRKGFILDYDCSTNEAEFENIISKLEVYNETAVTLFENSIEDELRKLLRGEDSE